MEGTGETETASLVPAAERTATSDMIEQASSTFSVPDSSKLFHLLLLDGHLITIY